MTAYPILADAFRLLSKLSPARAVNLCLLSISYALSLATGRSMHFGRPWTASIEPTTACNLCCPECPSGLRKFTRPTGSLSMELYRSVIDQLSPELFYLILYFQGEPFLNRHFYSMVEYARNKKIYTTTSTNGHFLSEDHIIRTIRSGLDRLVISLDGSDRSTYERYRIGGDFDRVVEGIRRMVKLKKELHSSSPLLVLQFIVFRFNEHQLGEIRALARELGVDRLEIKTARICDFENGHPLIPSNPEYSRYRKLPDGHYAIRHPLKKQCKRMWRGCVITWDGLVVPCCFDKDAGHPLGDLKHQTFREIWNGKEYDDFRGRLLTARDEIDICKNCTER